MSKITFYHCADLHLDTPFKVLSSKPGLPGLRRKAILDNLARLIDSARGENPDFLLIAGDLFEHGYTSLRTVSAVNDLFASVPDTRVVMIAGNHDPEAGNSPYRTFKWNKNVTFLGNGKKSIYFEELNTEIFGLGWVSGTGQAAGLGAIHTDPGRINILIFHGDIDLQIGDRDYNSISSGMLMAKGFDYVAAGHNHKRKSGECGGIFHNPGSLEPLGFDEPGMHGYFKGTLERGVAPDVTFTENTNTVYETIEKDISSYDSDENILSALRSDLAADNILYKVVLTGQKPADFNPDTGFIEKEMEDSVLFVKVRDKSTVKVSVEELRLMKGLKGVFIRRMLEKMETADEAEKELLEKALYYGIDSIDNGKIEKAGGVEL